MFAFLSNKIINQKATAFVLAFVLATTLLTPLFLSAAANYEINYQGKLTDSTGVTIADGNYDMEFKLYTASSGGAAIWTETRTGGNQVTVTNGLFSVMLGDVSSLAGVDFDQTLYLGVNIESDGEMSPRKIFGAVPAAFVAQDAGTVGGVASSSFLRSDQADTIEASASATLLSIIQNGTGDIFNLFDGGTEVFTVLDGGNVGIGTTDPGSALEIYGASKRLAVNVASNDRSAWLGNTPDGTGELYLFNGSNANTLFFTGNGDSFINGGNVGIGTTSPAYKLDVVEGGSGNSVLRLRSGTAGGADAALRLMETAGGGDVYGFSFEQNGSDNRLYVRNHNNSQAGSVAMAIDRISGNVGIGTTSPSEKLHVVGNTQVSAGDVSIDAGQKLILDEDEGGGSYISDTGAYLRYYHNGAAILQSGGSLRAGNFNATGVFTGYSGNDTVISQASTQDTIFENNAGDSLAVIKATGNVGIGTTDPNTKLEVNGTASSTDLMVTGTATTTNLRVGDGSESAPSIAFSADPDTGFYRTFNDTFAFSGGGSNILSLSSIGLYMDSNTGAWLRAFGTHSAAVPTYTFANDANTGMFSPSSNADVLGFSTDGVERLRIDPSGNIGIATTTPNRTLTVAGDFGLTGAYYDANYSAGTNGMVLQTTGTTTEWVATSTLGITAGDSSPLTTKGDLYTYDTDNARLGVGTNGQVLMADSGEATGLKWADASDATVSPSFSVAKSTTQSGVGTSPVLITWETEDFDTNSDFDLTTERFTPTVPGKYLLTTSLYFNSLNNLDYGYVYIYKNGSPYKRGIFRSNDSSAIAQSVSVSVVVDANGTSDYFEVYGDTNNSAETVAGGSSTYFTGSRIGGGSSHWAYDNGTLNYNNRVSIGTTSTSSLLTIASSSTDTLLSVTQNGTGDIFNLFDGGTEVFTVEDGGNIGIGTTTPNRTLTVAGDFGLTGAYYDANYSAGTNGMVLQTTGTTTEWVATSTLGITAGDSSPLTTKGDLYTYDTDNARLGVGTNGQVLMADSGEATGLKWATLDTSGSTSTVTASGIGMVSAFPTPTCPAGWLQADGSAVSRTTYTDLYAEIGTTYGSGDGSTTFDLPDYRGYFLRGFDDSAGIDPDAGSRTDRGDGTTGDAVGTKQADEFESHQHGMEWSANSPNNGTSNRFARTSNGGGTASPQTDFTGGNETRPTNISVNYCISYRGGVSSGIWTANDSDAYFTSGKVSIGTTSTSSLLTIASSSTDTLLSVTQNGTGDIFNLFDGSDNVFTVEDGGNIGIGTTTPSSKLTVQGSGADDILNLFDSAGSEVLTVTNDGKVGIGTTTPISMFDVSGTAQLRGSVTEAGLYVDSNGKVGIGTTTPSSQLTIFDTVSEAQVRVAYDASTYAEFYVDAIGDLTLSATGGTVWVLDEDMYICESGACPTVDGKEASAGNLVVENVVYSDGTAPISCPTGMIPVPPMPEVGMHNGFCVDKYEAKSSSGDAVSEAAGTPWVSIAQYDARAECRRAGKHLITEQEWMAIARNVEDVGWNWNGGVAGTNNMSDGHSDNSPSNSLAADTTGDADDDPCVGTGQSCDTSTWNSQRRTYKLSNGEYIWDLGGNVWEWVDEVVSDDYPVANSATAGWQSCATSGDGVCGNTLTTNDEWYRGGTTATRGFIRGGNWYNGSRSGAFTLALNNAPSNTSSSLGFRCAR